MPTSEGETLDPILRLDHEQLDVTVYDDNDDIKNISTDKLVFEARLKANSPEPLISKSSDDVAEIQKIDPVNGRARIFIVPDDTEPITKTAGVQLFCVLTVIDVGNRSSSITFKLPVTYRA